jgi:hypothetical protein
MCVSMCRKCNLWDPMPGQGNKPILARQTGKVGLTLEVDVY